MAALLLGKTAEAAERGIELAIDGEVRASAVEPRDVVPQGNLVDNAFDAASGRPARRIAVTSEQRHELRLSVGDNGPGIPRKTTSMSSSTAGRPRHGGGPGGRGWGSPW